MLTYVINPDGLSTIYHTEGVQGLFRGTTLALVGVSSGTVQFVVYEEMKDWSFERKRKRYERAGLPWRPEVEKLVSTVACLLGVQLMYSVYSPTWPILLYRYRAKSSPWP